MSHPIFWMIVGSLITNAIVGAIFNISVVFWIGIGGIGIMAGLFVLAMIIVWREDQKLR